MSTSDSAPVSPHQEASKHLVRMRSMSLNSPTELVDIKPLRPSRDYTSKLCSISWYRLAYFSFLFAIHLKAKFLMPLSLRTVFFCNNIMD